METVGISSDSTVDTTAGENQLLETFTTLKGSLLTRSWSWWWPTWIRARWGSLIRSSPRMALTVERCFNSNLSHLFQKSGIDKLLPEMKMDDFLFSPIGYSMNGITEVAAQKHENLENPQSSGKHRDPSFVTVHVTPQVLVHLCPCVHVSIPAELQLRQLWDKQLLFQHRARLPGFLLFCL